MLRPGSETAVIRKILKVLASGDIRYELYERYSRVTGASSILLSRLLYRRRLRVGAGFKVWGGIRFLIYGPGSISIGRDFHAVSARRRSFFTLFTPCHFTVIGDAEIVLGEHVGLNGTTIAARKRIAIGNDTMIGPNTIIVDHDGHAAWPPEERWIKRGSAAEIVIESDVWIGMNCIILKGVRIGRGSIIAAASVVLSDVEPHALYAGNPARKIKSLLPADQGSPEMHGAGSML